MTNTETLRMILSFYRFDMPLYGRERARAIRAKKRVLVRVLKKYGKYTLLIMLCVNLVYLLKKAGVHITLTRAMHVIFISTLAALLLVASVIIYLLAHDHDRTAISLPKPVPAVVPNAEPDVVDLKTETKVKPPPHYRMQIADFTCMPPEKKMTASFVRQMRRELVRSGGSDAAAFLKDTGKYQAPLILTGSVTKSTDGYMVIVRVVDSSSSEVVMLSRNSISGPDEIPRLAKKVAGEILRPKDERTE